MNTIITTNPTIAQQDIDAFQEKYHILLAREYVSFLLKFNGGYPKHSEFLFDKDGSRSLVNAFYGIGNMESNLTEVFNDLDGVLPKEAIAIADDPAGNQICLGIEGEYAGQIYFWIHDMEDNDTMESMFFIANGFDEFFNHLRDE